MARRAKQTRSRAAAKTTRPAHARARVSTRRMTAAPSGRHARSAGAASRSRGLGPETVRVTFDLRDVLGRPIRDPETFFTFRRLSDHRQIGDQIQLELTGSPAVFDLPAMPGDVVVCEIDPRRYRFVHSPVFFRSPGPSILKESRVFREPLAWTPRFVRWDDLTDAFADLRRVLAQSPQVTLFNGVDAIAELLTDDAYDNMSGEAVTMAKTALLNIYFRLGRATEPVADARSWFSYVTRIVAIGRERFLGFVEPEMEARVREIHQHIDQFRGDYERTPSENHRGNVPAALRSRITSMISIKSTHRKGNFQLTLSHLSGPSEVFLDADLDESGDLLGHTLDLFKHKFTGGTHPHDLHELLVAQEGQSPGFDLGYKLV